MSEDDELRCLKAQLQALRETDAGVFAPARAAEFTQTDNEGAVALRLVQIIGSAFRNPSTLAAWPGKLVRLLERRGLGVLPTSFFKFGRAAPVVLGIDVASSVQSEEPEKRCDVVVVPGPPPPPASLAAIRLALVADGFTTAGLIPECRCVCPSPEDWGDKIQSEPPHLLLVESAWQGNNGKWAGHVIGCSPALRGLVASCREAGIPTVFWNKEDPLHFEAFISAARLFDYVCTTDAASIPRYRRELGHDRVYLLPFAYQPRLHHPIQQRDDVREEASVFAGAWYGNLPERCRDFVELAGALALAGPIAILDRATLEPAPDRCYPERFRQYLREGVPYVQTPSIYRRHRIGLTLNTIKDSPTMFARRALELMGCNTSVYGNFSSAMHALFGDLTVSSDDGGRILEQAFDELQHPDDDRYRQRRLQGLRKVLLEYSWDVRLADLAEMLWGQSPADPIPIVNVVTRVESQNQLVCLLGMLHQAIGVSTRLWVQAPSDVVLPLGVRRLEERELRESLVALFGHDATLVAPWHPDDYYGPHYLQDLCLARKFGQGQVIGKAAYAKAGNGAPSLQSPDKEYRLVDRLALRRALLPASIWNGTIAELLDSLGKGEIRGEGLVSIDAGSYIERGFGALGSEVNAETTSHPGLGLRELRELARQLPASPSFPAQGGEFLSGATLAGMFARGVSVRNVSTSARRHRLELVSILPSQCEQVVFSHVFARSEVERDGRVTLCLDARPHSSFELALEALDIAGNRVALNVLPAGTNVDFVPAAGAAVYRLVLRVRGAIVTHLDGLWISRRPAEPLLLPGRQRLLLVTNAYPSADDLYRNAFVHRRVLAYRLRGVQVDVVRIASATETTHAYEYQGVAVQVCASENLQATLVHSGHRTIAVHFLDASIWQALAPVADKARIVVWVHGSDLQPWTRRPAHYRTEAELAEAKRNTETRLAFWRALLVAPPQGLHLIFVSQTFAEQSWEDLGLRLPDARWSVIPNPIDCELFEYIPKPAVQRFHILSIRPHHSRIYANDLVAETIRRLSADAIFQELHFTLVGDGPLWDENFAGLARFPNVKLIRRFIPQEEIAVLHKSHGVFLVPTRGDTQGVSRDEAMASGLVPVSCRIGAVQEFVPPGCGVLVTPESPEELAEAILGIAKNEAGFSESSERAVEAVGGRRIFDRRISNELELLGWPEPATKLGLADRALTTLINS